MADIFIFVGLFFLGVFFVADLMDPLAAVGVCILQPLNTSKLNLDPGPRRGKAFKIISQ